jgi:hypothetical protein
VASNTKTLTRGEGYYEICRVTSRQQMVIASAKPSTDPWEPCQRDVIAIAIVGVDLGTKRLDLRLKPPVLFAVESSARERRMDVVSVAPLPTLQPQQHWICSCLIISAVTIVSRPLHVLKSTEPTSNSSLQAQKLTSQGTGSLTLSHHTVPDDALPCAFVEAIRRSSSPTILMANVLGPNESDGHHK